VAHEPHLAEHVAAPSLVDALAPACRRRRAPRHASMMTYISSGRAAVRTIASPREVVLELAHQHDDARLRGARPANSGMVRAGSSPSFTPRRSQSVD